MAADHQADQTGGGADGRLRSRLSGIADDLGALLACARAVQQTLGRPLGSHTLVAGPVDWHAPPG